jgi:hypothetical protein
MSSQVGAAEGNSKANQAKEKGGYFDEFFHGFDDNGENGELDG